MMFNMKSLSLFLATSAVSFTAQAQPEAPETPAPRILIGTPAGAQLAMAEGGVMKRCIQELDICSLEFETDKDLEKIIKKAQDLGFSAEVDQPRTFDMGIRNGKNVDRKLAEDIPWGINRVYEKDGVPDVPDLSFFPYGADMSRYMCVIDSGYTNSHPDLPDGVTHANPDIGNIADSAICQYHGTHVAGTVQAIGGNGDGVIGVYPGADTTKVVKVFRPVFFGLLCGFVYASDLIGAAYDCADAGAGVINMSLGGGAATDAEANGFQDLYTNRGVLSVAAAGNDGNTVYSYPASYDAVMSVAATDVNNNHASFSQRTDQVEVGAPGVDVISTIPPAEYVSYDGTSMASPHVAGVALVLLNKYPDASVQLVRHALNKGAIDLGAPGYDTSFGNGLLNYWNSAEIVEDCDEGVSFQATYQGNDYNLPCQWILEQTQFPQETVCSYPNGNAGDVCTCVC
jgi:subtilisin family serine protease